MEKQGKGPNKHQLISGLETELVHSQAMALLCDSPACWGQTEKVFWRPFFHFQNDPLVSLSLFPRSVSPNLVSFSSGPSAHSHSQGMFKFCSSLAILKVCEWHYQSLEWGHGKQRKVNKGENIAATLTVEWQCESRLNASRTRKEIKCESFS